MFETKPLESKPKPAMAKEKPEPTYWFERDDGTFFGCSEKQAWNILKGRIQIKTNEGIVKKKHKYLGMSNGSIYFQGLADMRKVFEEKGLEEAQNYLRELEVRERESADPKIVPRNADTMSENGHITSIQEIERRATYG